MARDSRDVVQSQARNLFWLPSCAHHPTPPSFAGRLGFLPHFSGLAATPTAPLSPWSPPKSPGGDKVWGLTHLFLGDCCGSLQGSQRQLIETPRQGSAPESPTGRAPSSESTCCDGSDKALAPQRQARPPCPNPRLHHWGHGPCPPPSALHLRTAQPGFPGKQNRSESAAPQAPGATWLPKHGRERRVALLGARQLRGWADYLLLPACSQPGLPAKSGGTWKDQPCN